jgi:hypothetical protein
VLDERKGKGKILRIVINMGRRRTDGRRIIYWHKYLLLSVTSPPFLVC